MSNGNGLGITLETYLRVRPLESKFRGKLKVDYYHIHQNGLPVEHQTPEVPKSLSTWKNHVLAVQGHPMASGHHMSQREKDKYKESFYSFDRVFNQDTSNVSYLSPHNGLADLL
jgi:hypothetical protein